MAIVAVSAGGYSSGGRSSGGYGGVSGGRSSGGYGGVARAVRVGGRSSGGYGGVSGGYAASGYGAGYAVPASIQTTHNIEYVDVPSSGYIQPATVEVGANVIPVNIFFRSASSVLNVKQVHEGAQGTFHQSQSEDEPHRLVHQVTKPIYQEVREIVTPYRRIVQEIKPVQEQVNTIVARGGSKTVLADNSGQFVATGDGGLVGTVSTAVLNQNVNDDSLNTQVVEQQQITDVGDSGADLAAVSAGNFGGNYGGNSVSNVNVVENVQQVQDVQQAVSGDGY